MAHVLVHLASRSVRVGAQAGQGQKIGVGGNTSAKGPLPTHLHDEQRYGGGVVKAVVAGDPVVSYGHEDYISRNTCRR